MRQQPLSGHPPGEASPNGRATLATLAPPALAEYWGSEELVATLDSVGTGIWALDLEGRCVFINQAACQTLGYAREECLGERIQCRIHAGDCDGWVCPKEVCRVHSALESGSAVQVDDDVFRRRDGTSIAVKYSIQPVVLEGRTRGFVIGMTDITARKRAEESLRKSDEWLGLAQNAAGVGIFDLDLKTGEARVSEGQFRLFGLDPAGKPPAFEEWRKLVHPEDRGRIDRQNELTLPGVQPSREEYRVVWPDGSIHWLLAKTRVFFDDSGRPARLVGANVDITSRVRAETALNQFFSASPTPMAIRGFNGRIQQANRSWEPILGFAAAEMEELLVFDLVHPDDRAAAAAEFEKVLTSEKRMGFECRVRCKDGSYRWLLLNASAQKDGQVIYVTAHDITDQKKAEQAVRDSEAKFRELFDCAPVAYHELDMDGVVRRVNRAECALLGYEAGEMLGRPIWEFIAGAEQETSREMLRRKLSGEQPLKPYQRRYLRRDGSEVCVEIHDALVCNATGETTGIRTALLDITEHKRMEKDLRMIASVVESSTDFIGFASLEGSVLFLNPAARQMLGFDRDEPVTGGSVSDDFMDEDREWFRERVLPAVTRDGRWEGETRFKHRKTGAPVPVWQSIFFITEQGTNRRIAMGTICRDITERKRMEKDLRMIASVVESSTDFIGFASIEGSVSFVNPAGRQMLGLDKDEPIAVSVFDYFTDEDREWFRERVLPAVTRDGWWQGETRFKHRKTGAPVPMWQSIFFVTEQGTNRRIAMATICRDITERKRMEEALEIHAEKLTRSNAELERFAYVASHDLQEPLRMVASFTQLLAKRYSGKLDETADRYINFAVDGAQRMQQLIIDLLAYSRVNSKELDLRQTECEAVVQTALLNLSAAIDESGAVIERDPLPVLMADAAQLGQLFQNLIGNAIKFRGQAPLRIHIAATDNGPDWLFSVQDNGIGIDPRHSDRIFQIFQRLHPRANYPGTGIGLAVCNKVVERHGGRIWVESQPGTGSNFRFTLPKTQTNGAAHGRAEQVRRDSPDRG